MPRDELVDLLTRRDVDIPDVRMLTGSVTDASVSPPLIQVGASDTAVECPCLSTYEPVNGDAVVVLTAGATRICLGRAGNTQRTWTPQYTLASGTQPNVGTTGTKFGFYTVSGGWCHAFGAWAFSGTGVTGGAAPGVAYTLSIPVPANIGTAYNVVGWAQYTRTNALHMDTLAFLSSGAAAATRFGRYVSATTMQNVGPDELAISGISPVSGSRWSYTITYPIA